MPDSHNEVLKLTEDDVDLLNMKEALSWVNRLNINISTAKDLPSIKSMLKMEMMKLNGGKVRTIADASAMLIDLRGKDERKREILALMLDDIEYKIRNLNEKKDDPLPKQLEVSIPRCLQQIQQQTERLRMRKCPILFAGETSAGKSSLLNLILGDDMLPCSHLSNTSVICEISYDTKRWAKIYWWDAEKTPIVIRDSDVFKETLASFIHTKEDRSNRWPYKKAEIYLPVEMLKNGLYIVDSPGVGENAEVTRLVLDYLVEAFAFIYVINSSNAGGVQTDRLQNLLHEVASKKSPGEQSMFSAGAAIFVCNKWDLVPVSERTTVKENTFQKLQSCWPGVQSSQLFCMSTAESIRLFNNNFISTDFARFLDGIHQLVPVSLQNKINFSYNWTQFLVNRVIHHLNAFLNQAEKSKDKRKETFAQIKNRLERLEKQADSFLKELTQQVDAKVDEATQRLRDWLQQPDVIEKAQLWYSIDAPRASSWPLLNLSIKDCMEARIRDALDAWEVKNEFFQHVRPGLINEFRSSFLNIENQLYAVENMIATHDVLLTKEPECDPQESKASDSSERSFVPYDFTLKLGHKIALGFASPILVPIAVAAALVVFPVYGAVVAKDKILSVRDEQRLERYLQDPVSYLNTRTEEDFQKFAKCKELRQYVKEQLSPAYNCLQQLQDVVPRQIEADLSQVESLRNDQREANEYVKFYEPLKNLFKLYQKLLVHYKVTRLLRDDIDIDYSYVDLPDSSVKPLCSGLYSTIRHAFCYMNPAGFKQSETKQIISLRRLNISTENSNVGDYLKEEEAYRFIKQTNVVRFYYTTKDVVESTCFMCHILEPIKYNLREYIRHCPESGPMVPDDIRYKFLKKTIIPVAKGLEFLHERHFVHFDLSLETLAVDYDNQVKLTNISLRRMVEIDSQNDSVEEFLKYSHLAPEVLCRPSAAYTPYSDMYGLGLVMWEAWCGVKAYKEEICELATKESSNVNISVENNKGSTRLSPIPAKLTTPTRRNSGQSSGTPGSYNSFTGYVSTLFQKAEETIRSLSPTVSPDNVSIQSDSVKSSSTENDESDDSEREPTSTVGRPPGYDPMATDMFFLPTMFDKYANYISNNRPCLKAFYDHDEHPSSPSVAKWLETMTKCWEESPNRRLSAKNWLSLMSDGNREDALTGFDMRDHF